MNTSFRFLPCPARALSCGLCLFLLWAVSALCLNDAHAALDSRSSAANSPEPHVSEPRSPDAQPVDSPAAVAPAVTAPPPTSVEIRELWTGRLYSSTYRAGLCLGGDGTVRGVLLLRQSSGTVDVYHFQGQHKEGNIFARHSSGHSFQGQFDNEDTVSGTIKLKSGFTVQLKGQRAHPVELTETCRPLPE